jgi:hypothetical protein
MTSTDIIDAVARAAALQAPEIPPGIDLAAVEATIIDSIEVDECRREDLLRSVRELAGLYVREQH